MRLVTTPDDVCGFRQSRPFDLRVPKCASQKHCKHGFQARAPAKAEPRLGKRPHISEKRPRSNKKAPNPNLKKFLQRQKNCTLKTSQEHSYFIMPLCPTTDKLLATNSAAHIIRTARPQSAARACSNKYPGIHQHFKCFLRCPAARVVEAHLSVHVHRRAK